MRHSWQQHGAHGQHTVQAAQAPHITHLQHPRARGLGLPSRLATTGSRGAVQPEGGCHASACSSAADSFAAPLGRVATAAPQPGASRLHPHFGVVRPECLAVHGYSRPAYNDAVQERHRRTALMELRTGIHWGPRSGIGLGCQGLSSGREGSAAAHTLHSTWAAWQG